MTRIKFLSLLIPLCFQINAKADDPAKVPLANYDRIDAKELREFIVVKPLVMPIRERLDQGLRIRPGYTVAVESFDRETGTINVRILKEADNGPNIATIKGFLRAIDSRMSEKMFEANIDGHIDSVFVTKKSLWLLSPEEEAALPKRPKTRK